MGGGKIMNIKLYSLIRYLQKPGGVSIEELQDELNVSRATVFRYLRILQEMNLPVTNDTNGHKNYYFFDMENPFIGRNVFENIPYLKDDFFFDKDEKMLIEYVFSNTEATVPTLRSDLKKLHEKMKVLLSFAGHVTESVEEESGESEDDSVIKSRAVRKIASFNDMPKKSEKGKLAIVSKLCDAVVSHSICEVTYRAVNGTPKTYRIMPLVVFTYQGGFYTIVETEKHEYTSKLAIERIQQLNVLDEKFKRKTTLDIPWIMTDPFGLVQVDQFEAQIRIQNDSVERIKDRAWPEKRVTFSEPAEDGSIIMNVITSGEFELIRWLRYMGTEARLIGPDWLVHKLRKSIRDLENNYVD